MEEVSEIEFDELKCLMDTNQIILFDVRTPEELKTKGRIPNSMNIPIDEFKPALEMDSCQFLAQFGIEKPSLNQSIALSCQSGRRARKAYEIALQAGYCNSRWYSGSFNDWVAQGGPVI